MKKIDKGEKYRRRVSTTVVDVYDILIAFNVTNPAVQHAIKKLLMPGQRGSKDKVKDLEEALWSVRRAIDLENIYKQ